MVNKTFKPQLAPNEEINLKELKYPLLASTKLDGIRIIFYKGKILTRSLKALPNRQLNEKFEPIRKFSEDNQYILDGEIYSHELNFQEIISFCMTDDLTDSKTVKKNGKILEIPTHLKFYMFDGIKQDNFDEPFGMRYINNVCKWSKEFPILIQEVVHKVVNNAEEVNEFFEYVLDRDYEGLILRNPESSYKCGRGTVREANIFKVKPFCTIDGLIKGVVQSTEVDPNAEKKINELGRSVTSKKLGDRNLIDKASAFIVGYEGKDVKVTLSMTDEEKKHVWEHQDEYIGKWVEYKYLKVGMKEDGLPRHPTTIRMRNDK